MILINKKQLAALLAVFVILQLAFSVFVSRSARPNNEESIGGDVVIDEQILPKKLKDLKKDLDKPIEYVKMEDTHTTKEKIKKTKEPVVVDNAFLKKFAFDIKLNPDLMVTLFLFLHLIY